MSRINTRFPRNYIRPYTSHWKSLGAHSVRHSGRERIRPTPLLGSVGGWVMKLLTAPIKLTSRQTSKRRMQLRRGSTRRRSVANLIYPSHTYTTHNLRFEWQKWEICVVCQNMNRAGEFMTNIQCVINKSGAKISDYIAVRQRGAR